MELSLSRLHCGGFPARCFSHVPLSQESDVCTRPREGGLLSPLLEEELQLGAMNPNGGEIIIVWRSGGGEWSERGTRRRYGAASLSGCTPKGDKTAPPRGLMLLPLAGLPLASWR